jgi:ABC-type branched-subunit amino acid transport system permease subunit
VPVEVGILAGAAAAAALGYVVGLVAVRRSGIQFAMITFAIAQFVYFLLLQASFTGGEDGMQRIPRNPLLGMVDVSKSSVFYYVILALTVASIALFYRITRRLRDPAGIRTAKARVNRSASSPGLWLIASCCPPRWRGWPAA